jgi:hypothetical protein
VSFSCDGNACEINESGKMKYKVMFCKSFRDFIVGAETTREILSNISKAKLGVKIVKVKK